eukprot:5591739-Prymnesium_polylepis.1
MLVVLEIVEHAQRLVVQLGRGPAHRPRQHANRVGHVRPSLSGAVHQGTDEALTLLQQRGCWDVTLREGVGRQILVRRRLIALERGLGLALREDGDKLVNVRGLAQHHEAVLARDLDVEHVIDLALVVDLPACLHGANEGAVQRVSIAMTVEHEQVVDVHANDDELLVWAVRRLTHLPLLEQAGVVRGATP